MITATSQRQPELTGQIVVVIGGGAGTGLQTARPARAESAETTLTGALSSAAFGAAGPDAPGRFVLGLPEQAGRMVVTPACPAAR